MHFLSCTCMETTANCLTWPGSCSTSAVAKHRRFLHCRWQPGEAPQTQLGRRLQKMLYSYNLLLEPKRLFQPWLLYTRTNVEELLLKFLEKEQPQCMSRSTRSKNTFSKMTRCFNGQASSGREPRKPAREMECSTTGRASTGTKKAAPLAFQYPSIDLKLKSYANAWTDT